MAASTELDEDDGPIAQINIIPFVDITLVLLIIFLLTSSLIARASIPVDLPSAASSGEVVDPTVNVVLTADGSVFVDGQPAPRGTLRETIERRVSTTPKLRAAIAADKTVHYEDVVAVIDSVRRAGVSSFALNIELTASGVAP